MFRVIILLVCIFAPLVISKWMKDITCRPVCKMYCPYGKVLDENGCPICKCKPSPCGNEQAPLAGYFCGDGPNRTDCPSTYECVTAPNKAYAVCCPCGEEVVTEPIETTEKPGSCPPASNVRGVCLANCSNDNNCDGDLKCCGSCLRECIKPVF